MYICSHVNVSIWALDIPTCISGLAAGGVCPASRRRSASSSPRQPAAAGGQPADAGWIPSISVADHYPEVKQFFAEKGIKTEGFIQWR